MATSFDLFSGLSRLSTVPAGSLANAASVGAKTVNGPLPWRVSTRPAAFTAATRVLKLSAPEATDTRSLPVVQVAAEAVLLALHSPAKRLGVRVTVAARATTVR